MHEPVTINGSSGGGQMLRNAVALSAVSGHAVRVVNIRGARSQPGLRPQHLMAVRAVAEVCNAALVGAEIGSREIEFHPGEIASKTGLRLDVGTAGSVLLVLQSLLPARRAGACSCPGRVVGSPLQDGERRAGDLQRNPSGIYCCWGEGDLLWGRQVSE